ncbi:MAG: hypothetical protein R2867_25445 [Caldilineaceae bacterium]
MTALILAGWTAQKGAGAAGWNVENGYMEVVPGTGGIESETHFGDCQLHPEWAVSSIVKGESQGR